MFGRRFVMFSSLALAAVGAALPAIAQTQLGTAFTYQGRLDRDGAPFTGTADVSITLWDAPTGGTQIGSVAFQLVQIVKGAFTVSPDFGAAAFDGHARWIEITVTPIGFIPVTLSPRQAVTATPYALQARGVFVDSATNVGLGTTHPTAKLDIIGNAPFPHLRVAARDDVNTPYGAFLSLDASPVSGGKNWLMYATSDAAGEGAGKLIFRNYTDNAQGVTFDAAGMVGIGTYTPYAQLHVAGGPSMNQVRVDSADAGGTWLNLANSTANGRQWSFVSTGAGSPEGPGKLLIRDQLAESTRVVVDSAGRVGVGTDATAASLTVGGNGSLRFVNSLDPLAYYQGSLYFGNGTGTYIAGDDSALYMTNGRVFVGVNDAFFVECQPGEWAHLFRNAVQGSYLGGMTISNDGYLYLTNRAYGASGYARLDSTGNWSVASDRRLKRDIQPLDGLLDKTLALRPVSYFYNNQDMTQTPHRQLGFIAQDVEPLFPSLVLGDEQKSLNYAGLSVVAIGAVQELKREKDAQIEALRAENAALKARLATIEAAVSRLSEHRN